MGVGYDPTPNINMCALQITKGTTRAILELPIQHPYAPYIRAVTKDILTDYEWDHIQHKKITLRGFSYYNMEKKQLYVPINSLDYILATLVEMGAEYNITDEPSYTERAIDLKMIDGFTPRPEQVDIIEYLGSNSPYRKGLATATGSGKTVSTIAGIVRYGKAAIVVVSGLQDQWIRQFKNFTNIGEKIYLVQGFQSLAKLMETEYKPDVIVFSLETLRLYVLGMNNYKLLPTFDDMLRYFGIGVKVMDEVHLNFHAQTLIDLSCNINNNIYLTATFNASNTYTKKILELIYPPDMRYGEHTFNKYIDVVCYVFRGDVQSNRCMRQRGYMHTKYETYLLKKKYAIRRYFNQLIMTIVQEQYILKRQPGDKMMIYFARTSMVQLAHIWFTKNFPHLKSTIYISGIRDDVLDKSDIIITTPKKGGTGTDVKHLIFVLNTVSFKTPVSTEQLRGRLRELKDDRIPVYGELVDTNIEAQDRHRIMRSYVHKRSARSYTILKL